MAVLCLSKFSNQKIDTIKAMKMALFHDLAEALLGDTFHYDKDTKPQAISEGDALKQILTPIAGTELSAEIYDLWDEFEHGGGPEAVFGHSWVKYGITKEKALQKNSHIEQSSQALWSFTKDMLEESRSKGWIL